MANPGQVPEQGYHVIMFENVYERKWVDVISWFAVETFKIDYESNPDWFMLRKMTVVDYNVALKIKQQWTKEIDNGKVKR